MAEDITIVTWERQGANLCWYACFSDDYDYTLGQRKPSAFLGCGKTQYEAISNLCLADDLRMAQIEIDSKLEED